MEADRQQHRMDQMSGSQVGSLQVGNEDHPRGYSGGKLCTKENTQINKTQVR